MTDYTTTITAAAATDDPRHGDEARVERMARAWWRREQEVIWEGGFDPIGWGDATASARAAYRDYATAALAALREMEGK